MYRKCKGDIPADGFLLPSYRCIFLISLNVVLLRVVLPVLCGGVLPSTLLGVSVSFPLLFISYSGQLKMIRKEKKEKRSQHFVQKQKQNCIFES